MKKANSSVLHWMLSASLPLMASANVMAEIISGGEFSAEGIYVDGKDGKFSEYNGLDDDGNTNGAVSGSYNYLDTDNADTVSIKAKNLGLDTFSIEGAGGEQGDYEVRIGYSELKKIQHNEYWITSDGDVVDKDSTGWDRDTIEMGLTKFFGGHNAWKLDFDYSIEEKEGTKVHGGAHSRSGDVYNSLYPWTEYSSWSNEAAWPQPIDLEHDQASVSLSYTKKHLQAEIFGYYSEFERGNEFSDNLSPVPDNEFMEFGVRGGYNVDSANRISFFASYGTAEQDEAFGDSGGVSKVKQQGGTALTDSQALNLLAQDLDAEVNVARAKLGYFYRINSRTTLNMDYSFEDRDTDTDHMEGLYSNNRAKVNGSSSYNAGSTNASNSNYDWTKHKAEVELRHRFNGGWRGTLGGQFRSNEYEMDRKYADFDGGTDITEYLSNYEDEFDEWQGNIALKTPNMSGFSAGIDYTYTDRDADVDKRENNLYTVGSQVDPETYYTWATFDVSPSRHDMEEHAVKLTAMQQVGNNLTLSLNAQWSESDYSIEYVGGLDDRERQSYTLDAMWLISRDVTLSVFGGFEALEYDTDHSGEAYAGSLDWAVETEDETTMGGLSLAWNNALPNFDLGLDFHYQEGEVDSSLSVGSADDTGATDGDDYDTIETEVTTVTVKGDYRVSEELTISARYVYEDYDSQDPYWDGWAPSTGYNYESPNYEVHATRVGFTYKF